MIGGHAIHMPPWNYLPGVIIVTVPPSSGHYNTSNMWKRLGVCTILWIILYHNTCTVSQIENLTQMLSVVVVFKNIGTHF